MCSVSDKDKVVARLTEFENTYLTDPVHGWFNPFRRPGITLADIAYLCDYVKDETTASGRVKPDLAKARKLANLLIAEDLIEITGSHRTMQAGSTSKNCYALKGFSAKLMAVIASRK